MHHNCKCEYCRQEARIREREAPFRQLPWSTVTGACVMCLLWIAGILVAWWVKP